MLHLALVLLHFLIAAELLCRHHSVVGRTMSDDISELRTRNGTVIMGAIAGDVATVMAGVGEGGDLHPILSRFLGEIILKLGVAGRDFPICPAIHLSFFMGEKANLDTAFYIAKVGGGDINDYRLPDLEYSLEKEEADPLNQVPHGYPPAVLYSIGLGKPPNNRNAAFLSRFYETLGRRYLNMTSLKQYLALTGNPPLIHMSILSNFFDGTYVLAKDLQQSVNSADFHGLTPLHLAAWLGDLQTISFLLYAGGNRFTADMLQRIPLHYAAMRGNVEAIKMLLTYNNVNTTAKSSGSGGNSNKKVLEDLISKSVNHRDMFGFTAVDLAEVHPPIQLSIAEINKIVKENKLKDHLHVDLRTKTLDRVSKGKVFKRSVVVKERTDSEYFRGGWTYHFDSVAKLIKKESDDISKFMSYNGNKKKQNKLRSVGIDVLDSQSDLFYKDYFSREYVINQRPVVISNMPTAQSILWAYWRMADFLTVFGDLRVFTGEKMYTDNPQAWNIPKVVKMKVSSYVKAHMKSIIPSESSSDNSIAERHGAVDNKGETHLGSCQLSGDTGDCLTTSEENKQKESENDDGTDVSGDDSISKTKSSNSNINSKDNSAPSRPPPSTPWVGHVDLSNLTDSFLSNLRPDFLDLCGDKDSEPMRMTLGPRGSGSPIHSHNSSWNVLLVGVKKWYLIAPGFGNQSLWNEEKDIGVLVRVPPVSEWIEKKLSSLRQLGIVHEVHQYPGDVLYIPHNWWHVTESVEDSVSISQEICTLHNTNLRIQPLGFALYGGADPHRGLGTPVHYHLATDKRYTIEKQTKDAIKLPLFSS